MIQPAWEERPAAARMQYKRSRRFVIVGLELAPWSTSESFSVSRKTSSASRLML